MVSPNARAASSIARVSRVVRRDHGLTRKEALGVGAGAAAGAVLSALTGCGAPGGDASSPAAALTPATIQVHQWDPSPDQLMWPDWIKRFEARYPGVKVQQNPVPGAEYHTKLQVLIAGGTPPDFFFDNAAPDYMYMGVLEVLDPYVKRDKLNLGLLYEDMVNNRRLKGQLLALPSNAGVKVWIYNADLYREAGVADPNELYDKSRWSWTDFVETAQRFRTTNPDGQVTRWHGSMTDYFSVLPQNKASILSADLRKVTVAEPNAIEAFQFMQDAIWKHRIHPGAAGTPAAPQGGYFANRLQVGQENWGSYDFYRTEVPKYPQPFTWDVAPLPYSKGKGANYGPGGWAVPKGSPRKEQAWALNRFIVFTLENQMDVARVWGVAPLKEANEKVLATLTDPKHGKRALLEPMEKGYAFRGERFTFPKWQEFAPTASREVGAIMRNEKSARDACEAMAAELRRLVDTIKWD